MTPAPTDRRFTEPLYTVTEAATYLGMPPRTLWDWTRGPHAVERMIATAAPASRRDPIIPFVGLAEGMVLRAFRQAGLTMPYVKKALRALRQYAEEQGITAEYALASQKLHKHGAKILYEYSDAVADAETRKYFELVSRNGVFTQVVEGHLERIFYEDEWASRLILPKPRRKIVVVDPNRASGQPLTIKGGARIVDIIDRFRGDESLERISRDFGVPERDVLDIIRAFYTPVPEAA